MQLITKGYGIKTIGWLIFQLNNVYNTYIKLQHFTFLLPHSEDFY